MPKKTDRIDTDREEKAVLGFMLTDNSLIDQVAVELAADELDEHHARLFNHVCELWSRKDRPPNVDARRISLNHRAWEDPDLHRRMGILATDAEGVARGGSIPLERAIRYIHFARSSEGIWAHVQKLTRLKEHSEQDRLTIATHAKAILEFADKGPSRPMFSELEKIMQDPPIYYLRVHMMKKTIRMKLSLNELAGLPGLQAKIFANFDYFPDYMPSKEQWKLILNRLSDSMVKKAVDEDSGDKLINVPQAELEERIEEYLQNAKRTEKLSELGPRMLFEDLKEGLVGLAFNDLSSFIRQKVSRVQDGSVVNTLVQLGFQRQRKGVEKRRLWIRKEALL